MSVTRRTVGGGTPAGEALAAALAARGVSGRVEARASLAIVVTDAAGAARLTDEGLRREALALAREQGFSHLAVELAAGPQGTDAALPGA
jgi:Mg-chelatase subunit ChlD